MAIHTPTKQEVKQGIQNWNRLEREYHGVLERDIIDIFAEEKIELADIHYVHIAKEYSANEETVEYLSAKYGLVIQRIGDNRIDKHSSTVDPNSFYFASRIMKIVDEISVVCHVLSWRPHERLGIVADIVRNEVLKVPYFSELIQNGKSQIECEHDIENKILEFARQKTTTFFNLDRVEARFSNKTTEWFEIEITFYDIEHKVLNNIFYPKKEFDESALAYLNKGEDYI
jgi:hypothetical protein